MIVNEFLRIAGILGGGGGLAFKTVLRSQGSESFRDGLGIFELKNLSPSKMSSRATCSEQRGMIGQGTGKCTWRCSLL